MEGRQHVSVPTCLPAAPAKSWGPLNIAFSSRIYDTTSICRRFKTFSLLTSAISCFSGHKVGNICGDTWVWKRISAWVKTQVLKTQLCPNCIESETWPLITGQVTKPSFSFGFILYHNTPSKQQQKLGFCSWRDLLKGTSRQFSSNISRTHI